VAGSVEAVRGTVCTVPLVLAPSGGVELLSPDQETELYEQRFNSAAAAAAAAASATASTNGDVAEIRPTIGGLAGLRLASVAKSLHGDWVPLASQLGITQREIVKIQTEFTDTEDQAMIMLHLWAEKAGTRATSSELEKALHRIGRDDLLAANQEKQAAVPDLAQTPESDHLNPIDSPLNANDAVPALDLDGSTDDRSFLYDVEPGAEYELEQVWDGTKWQQTKRLIPVAKASTDADHNAEVQGREVEAQPKKEESDEIQQVTVPSTNFSNNVDSLTYDSALNPFSDEAERSLDQDEVDKVEAVVQETSAESKDEVNHEVSASVLTNDMKHMLPGSQPDGINDNSTVESHSTEPKVESHSTEPGVESHSTEPEVKTEVEESEEVLEDGTIIKRRSTKTIQVQPRPSLTITTPDGTCLTNESVFDKFPAEFDENQMNTPDENGTMNTEIEETEETLEDGTIVKRRVVKTKQVKTSVVTVEDEGSEL